MPAITTKCALPCAQPELIYDRKNLPDDGAGCLLRRLCKYGLRSGLVLSEGGAGAFLEGAAGIGHPGPGPHLPDTAGEGQPSELSLQGARFEAIGSESDALPGLAAAVAQQPWRNATSLTAKAQRMRRAGRRPDAMRHRLTALYFQARAVPGHRRVGTRSTCVPGRDWDSMRAHKRRDVRAVEGARLESAYTVTPYRGFESLSLRQFIGHQAIRVSYVSMVVRAGPPATKRRQPRQ